MLPLLALACLAITDSELEARLVDRSGLGDSADSDSDADSDADSDSDSDSDSDTDTDTGPIDPCGSTDEAGAALHFASPSDYVAVPDSDLLDLGASWTLEFWLWYESSEGSVLSKWEDGVEDKSVTVASDKTPHLGVYAGSEGSTADVGGAAVPVNTWQHVAFVFNGTAITSFQDSAPGTILVWAKDAADGAGELRFGAATRDRTASFKGYVQDIRISNEAVYTTPFRPPAYLTAEGSTVGLWPLSEGKGSTATDSASGLHGTIHGATWESLACRQ